MIATQRRARPGVRPHPFSPERLFPLTAETAYCGGPGGGQSGVSGHIGAWEGHLFDCEFSTVPRPSEEIGR